MEEKMVLIKGAKAAESEAKKADEEARKAAEEAKKKEEAATKKKTTRKKSTTTKATKTKTPKDTTEKKTTRKRTTKKKVEEPVVEEVPATEPVMELNLENGDSLSVSLNDIMPGATFTPVSEDDIKDKPLPEVLPSTPEVEEPVKEETPVENVNTESTGEIDKNVTGGDKNCYAYFDIKLSSTKPNASPLSLGIVTGEGHSFYAEFTDFDFSIINTETLPIIQKFVRANNDGTDHVRMTGNKIEIRDKLNAWLSKEFHGRVLQFVTYKNINQFSILYDILLGGNHDSMLPEWISKYPVDLLTDVSQVIFRIRKPGLTDEEYNKNYVPLMHAASDVNLYKTVENTSVDDVCQGIGAGTAIFDAAVIRLVHRHIWAFD